MKLLIPTIVLMTFSQKLKINYFLNMFRILLFLLLSSTSIFSQDKFSEFKNVELNLHNQNKLEISSLKGKIVLIDFWYRGCLPCLKAIPDLISLQEEFKDDLIIIGINDFDNQKDVIDYFNFKGVNYASTYKIKSFLYKKMNIVAFPTIILINRNNDIISIHSGHSSSEMKKIRKKIIKNL